MWTLDGLNLTYWLLGWNQNNDILSFAYDDLVFRLESRCKPRQSPNYFSGCSYSSTDFRSRKHITLIGTFLVSFNIAGFHTKFSNDSSAGLSEQHVLCFMNKRVFQRRCLIACICFRHLWKMNDVFTFFCVFERSIVLEGVTTPVTQSPPNEKHSCPLVSGYYSKYNKLLPCQFRKNLVFILYKSRP